MYYIEQYYAPVNVYIIQIQNVKLTKDNLMKEKKIVSLPFECDRIKCHPVGLLFRHVCPIRPIRTRVYRNNYLQIVLRIKRLKKYGDKKNVAHVNYSDEDC